ncbi:MAG: peptidase S8 [Candidatus Sericytochromatia bacterium]|nr:peptidase S8 [Candidatus Sericytochromatia bacterium]
MLKLPQLLLSLTLLSACTGQTFGPRLAMTDTPGFQPLAPAKAHVSIQSAEPIQNELIVKYKAGFSTQSQRRHAQAVLLDNFQTADESTQLHRLNGQQSLDEALRFYETDPGVEFVMPNLQFEVQMTPADQDQSIFERIRQWFWRDHTAAVPELQPGARPAVQTDSSAPDPLRGQQWYLNQLQMAEVWQNYGVGQSGITVAVLDTGVDYDHPDLAGKVLKGPDYIDKNYDPKDLHGHGTHVAGVISAQLSNQEGISGMAPQVQILAIRVLDARGSGSLFNIAKGIAYAANQGAQVINLSLGSPPGGSIMRTMANFLASYTEKKGALIIAAAGNSAGAIGYPAAASRFMAVGAVNEQKYLATFSNRGPELDVVAPGVNILSTYPTYEVTTNALGLSQNYASLNGTSMATPMVSALAAMLWSQNPYLTPAEVRERIENTATDLGPIGRDDMFGQGLIHPLRALQDTDGD